ncbi:uncharacterized protein DC041_0011655 [Schistosoma bovis]|uniref:Radial spoke head 1 n=1 Tax=Schistosoma bovis TaxID=6184 RepID=A0A430Q046_SCHBO|nr:uncharacterized protein DC041_0011655 [Schistosoma bovis]
MFVLIYLTKEFAKYDSEPDKWIKPHIVSKSAKYPSFSVDVGYERFLGPEIFFQPENIVLSGGSSMFKHLDRRLQRDIKRNVDNRLKLTEELTGGRVKPKSIDVKVVSHPMQRYAVWFGGSVLANEVQRFKNGARYDGTYEDNKRQGQGTFYYPDGSTYEGNWSEGLRYGQGKYTYINGDTYEGEWRDHLRHGRGTYTFASTKLQYIGNWKGGKMDGHGELVHPHHRFIGTWKDGMVIGKGRYIFQNSSCQQMGEYLTTSALSDDKVEEEESKTIPRWKATMIEPLSEEAKHSLTNLKGTGKPTQETSEEDKAKVKQTDDNGDNDNQTEPNGDNDIDRSEHGEVDQQDVIRTDDSKDDDDITENKSAVENEVPKPQGTVEEEQEDEDDDEGDDDNTEAIGITQHSKIIELYRFKVIFIKPDELALEKPSY